MDTIERLKTYYENQAPQLSYGGSEGEGVRAAVYPKWPEEEMVKSLNGIVVWHQRIQAAPDVLPPDGYCVVDACLDVSGLQNPEALPLWPEMQGHDLHVAVYVDWLNCISMKAIGGFTSYRKREGSVKS